MTLLNITVPVFNEERILRCSIAHLHSFAASHLPFSWKIVIADNGSTDRTLEIARSLATGYANTYVLHLDEKGRGGALKAAWQQHPADVLTYMDADLSTDLEAFPALVESLTGGGHDVATGSRLLQPALTTRCFKRELTSRAYNGLVRSLLRSRFSDVQCGFKAITQPVARRLLPLVQDTNWFFDTELLVLAQWLGYRVFEMPVRWIENRNSHVRIIRTAAQDIRGILRLRGRLLQTEPSGLRCRRRSPTTLT